MRRFLYLLVILTLPGLTGADGSGSPVVDSARYHQLHRNAVLVQAFVTSGLSLAVEVDPLKRAESCSGLARRVAGEIQQAASNGETARALELGNHLNALLKRGVAANIRTVRSETPLGSARNTEIDRVATIASQIIKPLEELLQGKGNPDREGLRSVLQTLRDGKSEIEKANKSKHTL